MQAREEGTAPDAKMATREGALPVQQSEGASPSRAGEESHSVVPSSSTPKEEATRVTGDQAGTLALSQEGAEEDVAESFEEASDSDEAEEEGSGSEEDDDGEESISEPESDSSMIYLDPALLSVLKSLHTRL